MADPFSVTGSAVGVVSLGLTVCQGIVQYYAAYKGQDEEVNHAVQRVSHLEDLLEVLQPRLEEHKAPQPVTVTKVEECVVACSAAIERLKEVLQKCKQEAASNGFRETLRGLRRKALFPFRGDTLRGLENAVSECQANANTAISILQLDIHREMSRQISSLGSTYDAVSHNTATTLERTEEIYRMMNSLVPVLTQFAIRPQLQDCIRNIPAASSPIQSPGHEKGQNQRATLVNSRTGPYFCCTCHPRKKMLQSRYDLGPVTLFRATEVTIQHQEDCPSHCLPRTTQHQLGLAFRLGTTSKCWKAKAAVNYNIAIGAFSVSPSIAFRATVPEDHPTFDIFEPRGPNCMVDCRDLLASLKDMFQRGAGAPTDIDPRGRSLLQQKAAFRMMQDTLTLNYGFEEQWFQGFRNLVLTLCDWGVPVDELDKNGWSMLDQLLQATLLCCDPKITIILRDFRKEMVNTLDLYVINDVELCRDSIHKRIPLIRNGVGRRLTAPTSHLIDVLAADRTLAEGNSTFTQVVQLVDRLTGSNCGNISESYTLLGKGLGFVQRHNQLESFGCNAFGHTALHLAAGSPELMSELLRIDVVKAQVNVRDLQGELPLQTACWRECLASTKMLLEADSHVDLRSVALASQNPQLMGIVLPHLVDRMKRLKSLAEHELPPEQLKHLEIPHKHPMDVPCALRVLNALRAIAVPIPDSLLFVSVAPLGLMSPYGRNSLFCSMRFGARELKNFWDVGFRPDDQGNGLAGMFEFYSDGRESMDILLWASSIGFRVSPSDSHDILARSSYWPSQGQYLFPMSEQVGLFWKIFTSHEGVDHGCACCPDGCIPAVASTNESWPQRLGLGGLVFAERSNSDTDPDVWTTLGPGLIRRLLFNLLDLTHSIGCCKTRNSKRSWFESEELSQGLQQEIQERQEEELYLHSRLETLVHELCSWYEKLAIPLSRFIEVCVRGRAAEVLKGECEPSAEEVRRLKEVGIIIEGADVEHGDEGTDYKTDDGIEETGEGTDAEDGCSEKSEPEIMWGQMRKRFKGSYLQTIRDDRWSKSFDRR